MGVEPGVSDSHWPFPTGGTSERSGGRMLRGSCSPQGTPEGPSSLERARPPKVRVLPLPTQWGQASHLVGARSNGLPFLLNW